MTKPMPKQFIVIEPNGVTRVTKLKKLPTLRECQEAVDGYIERVPEFTQYKGVTCLAFANEDGLRLALPYNAPASEAWAHNNKTTVERSGRKLVGKVLLVTGPDTFLRSF